MSSSRTFFWTTLITGCFVIGVGAVLVFSSQRLLPGNGFVQGVSIEHISLSHLTRAQAETLVSKAWSQQHLPTSITVTFSDQRARLTPLDARVPFFSSNISGVLDQAYAVGHEGTIAQQMVDSLSARIHPISIPLSISVNDQALSQAFTQELLPHLPLSHDASFSLAFANPLTSPTVTIVPEQSGIKVDVQQFLALVHEQAQQGTIADVVLPAELFQPIVTSANLQPALAQLPTWLAHAPFKVSAAQQTWTVTRPLLASWLQATSTPQGITLTIDPEQVSSTLTTLLGGLLRAPKAGFLEVKAEAPTTTTIDAGANAKLATNTTSTPRYSLVSFIPPQAGLVLDVTSTIAAFETGWAQGSSTIPLVIRTETPPINGPDAQRLGIVDPLGTGTSLYAHSPSNRQKNIALGTAKIQGTLVAPNENFSLIGVLGPVDEQHGWFKELVIKDNKTQPDYGGGLCQIGTTTFRTVLAAGLPVTERQNHSYRVVYYEPAGTDATIYEPAPDFRFKNDTGHWLLFTTNNNPKHSQLSFTLWGTKDGRVATQTAPNIINITQPPPEKEVESTDIPVGTKKCSEHAHAGADASFSYSVTYPDGHVKSRIFQSHYKPWQAVCLIGVKHLSTTSTQPTIDTSGINNPN